MSTPKPPGSGESDPADKPAPDPAGNLDFDPYRFGLPDHPVPPEYAPPGYVFPNQPAPPPYPAGPWAPPTSLPPTYGPPPSGYPQYPPPQYPYGAPPPPMHHAYYQPKSGNGKAIAAMVLGILSIVFFWLTILDLALIIPAVIFGTLGLSDARTRNAGGRGQAIAGIVCAGVATVIAVVFTALVVHAANQCGGFGNSNDPGFNQCLKDHL